MSFTDPNVLFAFWLTVFAWLATWIWSLIGLMAKKTNKKFLWVSLGFSAWVMLYVSFVEIIVKWTDSLIESFGAVWGRMSLWWFFGGIGIIRFLDAMIPKLLNPHENHTVDELTWKPKLTKKEKKLLRMGMFTAVAIALHNFPEWLATFISAIEDPQVWVMIAIAIAIHNIPEWIAASVPIYYATWDRRKAFWWSFMSGLAEPLWVIIWYFLFFQRINEAFFGIIFSAVGWIMVFISLDKLLPTAREQSDHHTMLAWVIAWMAVMAISLQLFVI